MQLKIQLTFVLAAVFATLPWMNVAADGENMKEQHPYVFHLIQANLWEAAKTTPDGIYYPVSYTHLTLPTKA